MVVHAAFGGSTNLLLHIPAIAHAAGLRLPKVEDWISVNRRVPRLVTYAANRNEFVLRCISLASYGGFFLSMSLGLLLGLLIRFMRLGAQFFAGPYRPPGLVTVIFIPPILCFVVWLVLQWFTWFSYP